MITKKILSLIIASLLFNNQSYTMLRPLICNELKRALLPFTIPLVKQGKLKQTILPYTHQFITPHVRQLTITTQQPTLKNNKRCLLAKKIATVGGTMGLTAYALDWFSDHTIREKALTMAKAKTHTYQTLFKQQISSLLSENMTPETKNKTLDDSNEKFTVIPITDAQSCSQQIKQILESKQNPRDFRTSAGETLLVAASKFNDIDSLNALLAYDNQIKADVEGLIQEQEKALQEHIKALQKAQREQKEKEELAEHHLYDKDKFQLFIKKLTTARKNPNDFKTRSGKTPLMAACQFGDLKTVKTLMTRDNLPVDSYILGHAVQYNQVHVVKFLLAHPTLTIITDKEGCPQRIDYHWPNSYGWQKNESSELVNEYCKDKRREYYKQQAFKRKQEEAEKNAQFKAKLEAFCSK